MIELLEKADRMEDIIAIENQLADIIYQKENLTNNLSVMDDKVSYGTLTVNISEVDKLSNGIDTETSFLSRIQDAFKNSGYFFIYTLENLVIVFIYSIPYIAIFALVIYFGIKIIKRNRK